MANNTETPVKIKRPIKLRRVPRSHAQTGRAPKYGAVWKAVGKLADDQVLPVTCLTRRAVKKLQMAVITHRTLDMFSKVRGMTVYIGNKNGG
jgi:hypothetical protein